jgi:hypothetical protein
LRRKGSGAARPARDAGGGGGQLGAQVAAACGRFEIRQSSEGKRSASGFEAQVYSWVNQRYTWAVPRGPCRVYLSVTDEYTRQIHQLTDE